MRGLKRRTIVFCFGLLVVGVLSAVFTKPQARLAPSEEATVLAVDTALANAMRSGDKSAVRRLLSLGFTYIDENGTLRARKALLGGLPSIAPGAATDVTVKVYGLVAVVTGKRKSAQGSDTFFLDIWVKNKRAWHALAMQDVVLGADDAQQAQSEPPAASELRKQLAKFFDCKNPCETIPYRVRSPAEQDIVSAFQAIEKATLDRDTNEYARHLASEFVHYESDVPPVPRSERIARLEDVKERNIPRLLTAIQSMRLWVYGDGAAMISADGVPNDAEPLLRIARVWVKRDGRWQLAISVLTDVK